MRLRRRSGAGRERPPRLVLRFAIVSAGVLALVGASIVVVVRLYELRHAERAAALQAQLEVEAFLGGRLSPSDFERPLDPDRRRRLDALVRRHGLGSAALPFELVDAHGVITYSAARDRIGRRVEDATRDAAAPGSVVAAVTTLRSHDGATRKALRIQVPIAVGRERGLATVHESYESVAAEARRALIPVVAVLEGGLLVLYLALVPLLARVSRRMRRQLEELEYRAFHDELTGLANLDAFRSRLKGFLERGSDAEGRVGMLLFDLDRFRELNETLGHANGDAVLRELAARLVETVEGSADVARLGGDNFGILLPSCTEETALAAAARIHASLERPITIDGLAVEAEATIGVALSSDGAADGDTLMRHAEAALHEAKRTLAGSSLYHSARDTRNPRRLALVAELRRALARDELELHYQPQLDLRTRTIVGAEALVRWHHPDDGLVPPGAFVPLLERTQLIKPFTHFVLDRAIRSCSSWPVDLRVAVNVSARDIVEPTLPGLIEELLERHGLPPSRLELELTEGAIAADPIRALHNLERLHLLGVRLAIDDFGTGYSSLERLRDLAVDAIKIDKSFVFEMNTNPDDATIVRSVIHLGTSLALDVVAEGVETPDVLETLAALGCELAQGFCIARPMPESDLCGLAAATRLAA